mgnify:CR=1 FL=1
MILAILINEGELHGYALYKRILDITQMHWRPSIGTIYRLLNDMAKRGLVLKNTKGRRHEYKVTCKGMKYFIENSRIPLTRMTGMLATALEAYFRTIKDKPDALPEDLKERLRALTGILDLHSKTIESSG